MGKYLSFMMLLLSIFNTHNNEAVNLTRSSNYFIESSQVKAFNDNNYKTYKTTKNIHIVSDNPIKYVYIMYEINSSKGKLYTNTNTIDIGQNGYLHEFVELNSLSKEITLSYENEVTISEIHVYGEGNIPKDVQIWKKEDTTDLMIFSTHSDDEVLFFGGIIPTYINKGKKVHVTYLTKHYECKKPNQIRLHEVLDGLWESGVRDYPTFGILPDEGSRISKKDKVGYNKIIDKVKKQVKADGLSDDAIIDFYVKTIREYKPKVVLGHDEYGEYGHGQHIYNTYILKQAVNKAKTEEYITEGLTSHEVTKFYLHLYGDKKSQTIIDLDVPLEKYNNKTAYQVTKSSFKKHISQQKSKYPAWLNGVNNKYTKAKQIRTSNPMYWGLYYTSVGQDKNKNDLFENIN